MAETENPPERATAPDGLLIRAVRPDDAEGMATLANLPKYRFGTLRLPYESPEYWRKRIEGAAPGSLNLVALLDGTLVGSAFLGRRLGRCLHVADIGMGVHDDFYGRGIGTALLGALVEAADGWLNLKRLQLTVYTDNATAIRMYRRFGFQEEGILRAYAFRDGTYVDALTMARLAPEMVA